MFLTWQPWMLLESDAPGTGCSSVLAHSPKDFSKQGEGERLAGASKSAEATCRTSFYVRVRRCCKVVLLLLAWLGEAGTCAVETGAPSLESRDPTLQLGTFWRMQTCH